MSQDARNQSVRLFLMVEQMFASGAITLRQKRALEGIGAATDPKRIVHVLSCKR